MLRKSTHLRSEHRSLILLVCAAIGLSVWHGRAAAAGRRSWPETTARTVLGPLQLGLAHLAVALRDTRESVTSAGALSRENRALREEMAKLRTENARLHEDFRKYKAMSEQLGLPMGEVLQECPATVVSYSGGNWARRIDVVVREGWQIATGDAVLSEGALVGHVMRVDESGRRGTVRLLADKDSAVAGMAQRSRYHGMVYGPEPGGDDPEMLRMGLLEKEADIRVHDKIITWGEGMIYPSGLLVGEVVSVDRFLPSDVSKSASIRPAADFGRLEYVTVLRR